LFFLLYVTGITSAELQTLDVLSSSRRSTSSRRGATYLCICRHACPLAGSERRGGRERRRETQRHGSARVEFIRTHRGPSHETSDLIVLPETPDFTSSFLYRSFAVTIRHFFYTIGLVHSTDTKRQINKFPSKQKLLYSFITRCFYCENVFRQRKSVIQQQIITIYYFYSF